MLLLNWSITINWGQLCGILVYFFYGFYCMKCGSINIIAEIISWHSPWFHNLFTQTYKDCTFLLCVNFTTLISLLAAIFFEFTCPWGFNYLRANKLIEIYMYCKINEHNFITYWLLITFQYDLYFWYHVSLVIWCPRELMTEMINFSHIKVTISQICNGTTPYIKNDICYLCGKLHDFLVMLLYYWVFNCLAVFLYVNDYPIPKTALL